MKRNTAINFGWPVTLCDFSQDTLTENFSRGKLKVFFHGETADHRYFSKAFSDNLIQTLPYTPIVSYYDEEKDDFVGHATEQQILGIVDPCRPCSFETDENGVEWCICDVVLYTERPDKVGEIAKKIIGHPQSLELDPTSTKYIINYDEKKHFKNIEFTAGRFVGVSVLGNDQKPAFTGSEFFSYNENFEKKMEILRNYCESQKDDQSQHGGSKMNLQEFMKLSWGDISLKIEEKLCKEYENDAFVSIVDMFDDCVIARFFYFLEETNKLMKLNYTINEQNEIDFTSVNEVHVVYEDVVNSDDKGINISDVGTMPETDNNAYAEEGKKKVDESTDSKEDTSKDSEGSNSDPEDEDKKSEDFKDDLKPEDSENSVPLSNDEDDDKDKKDDDDEDIAKCTILEPAHVEDNVEITPKEDKKVSVAIHEIDNDNNIQENNTTSSTVFTESEKAELETLKREKKIALVNSYKDTISEEDYNTFISNIDNFSDDSLELEVLKSYKKYQEENNSNTKPMRAFSFAPVVNTNANDKNSLDSFVKKNLRKN